MSILFYEDIYYLFSNWSAHQVIYRGITYPTAEHAYHAQRFNDEKLKTAILLAPSPFLAKQIAHENISAQKPNWENEKQTVMHEVIKAKTLQHKEVRDVLKATKTEEIVENSPVDYYWGKGKDGNGKNELGKIWMRVRDEMLLEPVLGTCI